MHAPGLDLTNLAVVLAVAVGLGLILIRLRLPAMVGYIAAGVALGPSGLALVRDTEAVNVLAELGVLMLLFIAGMELSVPSFARALRPASLTSFGGLAASLAFAFGIASLAGWDWRAAVTFGFIVSLCSTAAALKILEENDELGTRAGEVAVAIAIAQDILVVPMLIFVDAFRGDTLDVVGVTVRMAIALALLAAVLFAFRKGDVLNIPLVRRLEGRTDLLALAALALCFGAAGASGLLGLSAAYGAFLSGLIVGATNLRKEMLRAAFPIQSLLIVIFFLSVGLLIDAQFITDNLALVTAASIGAVAFRTVVNIALLLMSGVSRDDAIVAGLATSQIGEFSFILAGAGLAVAVLDAESYRLAITVIAATLLISPIWSLVVRSVHGSALRAIGRVRQGL